MAKQVYQEIEVFQVVVTLVKESLQVGVNPLVDIPVMVFLHVKCDTS